MTPGTPWLRRIGLLSAVLLLATALHAQNEQPWEIGPFTRPAEGNPVIAPRQESAFTDPILKTAVHWEAKHTFNPAAVVRNGKIYVLYRAEDDSGTAQIGSHTSRLGLAVSDDGIHFTRQSAPVFFPDNDLEQAREWPEGVEDPRLVEAPDGTYVLTYTQWNGKTFSVGIATSPDLAHWTRHGPAFAGQAGGKYDRLPYKSAAIVTQPDAARGRLIAAQIDGYYWMYWGEGIVHIARSPDLIHWIPVEDGTGAPFPALAPRPKHFDSAFPEAGAPAVLTRSGIVVFYNGKNAPAKAGDQAIGAGAYSVGEALFEPDSPVRVAARAERPVLKPEEPFEKTGQYAAGATFAEGLVLFHNRWFLYYGCADSFVAVATAPAR